MRRDRNDPTYFYGNPWAAEDLPPDSRIDVESEADESVREDDEAYPNQEYADDFPDEYPDKEHGEVPLEDLYPEPEYEREMPRRFPAKSAALPSNGRLRPPARQPQKPPEQGARSPNVERAGWKETAIDPHYAAKAAKSPKPPRPPKPPKEKRPFPKATAGKAVVALVLSVVVFFVLLTVQRSALELPPTTTVLAAAAEIPASTAITAENVGQYFAEIPINTAAVPATAYTNPEEVIGKITAGKLTPNEVATPGRFLADTTAHDMPNPVEVSVSTTGSAYADGGRIRAGDRVNIGYISQGDEKQYVEILAGVYVAAALDSTGVPATSAEDGVVTTQFSLLVPKADAETLYAQIEMGNVVVQKVKQP